MIAFGQIGVTAAAATPYLALFDRKDPGYATAGYDLGAGRHLDGFAAGIDVGGQMRRGGTFGWMGRTRFDAAGKDPLRGGSMAIRVDSIGMLQLAGDPAGRLSLEGLGGFTVWPRLESTKDGTVSAFVGVGPFVGVRWRATAERPRISGEVEVAYAPLFGAPPTGRLHHLELGPAIAVSPWPRAPLAPAFEARARFEVGMGGGETGYSTGLVAMLGVRLRLDVGDEKKK